MLKTGIRIEVILLIRFIPRLTIKNPNKAKRIPNMIFGIGISEQTAFVCTKLPVVNEFKTHKKANIEPKINAKFSLCFSFTPS